MYVKMTVTHTRGKNVLSTNQSNIIFQSLMTLYRKHRKLLFKKCGFLFSSEVRNKRNIWRTVYVFVCVCVCVFVCDCLFRLWSINKRPRILQNVNGTEKRSLNLYRQDSWWSIKASVSDLPVISLWIHVLSSCETHVQERGQTDRQTDR